MNHSNHLKLVLGAAAVLVVLAAFGVPVLGNLPFLAVLLVCPLMMVFMMRGMDHGGSDEKTDDSAHSAHRR